MKKTLLFIFLLYIHTVTYGQMVSRDSVCVSISFGIEAKGELYIDMKDDSITINAFSVISRTRKEDMDQHLLYITKKECRLNVPERISKYLKETIRELFISHNQPIYYDSTSNKSYDQEPDFILKANIQKNNGKGYELYMPLLESDIEKNKKYSFVFTEFIQTLRYLSVIAMKEVPVLEKPSTKFLCADNYDMVKLIFEGIPNWKKLSITITPISVTCYAEAPFYNTDETKKYENMDVSYYNKFGTHLSISEEKYIRAAINDFFITQSIPIYSIRRKVSDESFACDAFSDYLNWIIYSGNCTKHVDMYLASAYKTSTTQIENYEISYSDQFMRFLQFLFYLRANALGGEYLQWYKNDIGRMKKNQKYHVYEFK